MEDPVRDLQTLGAATARALEAYAPERAAAIEKARRDFLLRPDRDGSRPKWHWALAFASLALMVFAVSSVFRTKAVLSFRVDARVGRTNDQISALEQPVLLAFSEGTALTLSASTRAHVVSLAEHGATIALESGSLDASVIHTGVGNWLLNAGPFSVRVTGTKFSLSWDPGRQHFSIRVTDGGVSVSGSLVGAECPVRAGQTLVVSVPENRFQLTNEAPLQSPQPVASTEAAPPVIDQPAGPGALVPSSKLDPEPSGARTAVPGSASSSSVASWRTLAKQGRLREAYASVDETGFESACDSATAAELLLLGDAARLSGRPDRVSVALSQLRRRFPADPRSAVAAFMLGKVAFDRGGADRAAASWFATSLREQPRGSLAREAAGRLMEALQRSGDSNGARRAAKDYLSWYPDGPHAALARSLLQ